MHIPARIIRRQCDDLPGQRPHLSFRDQEKCERILDAGQAIMAIYGRGAIRLADFALGLRMAPGTVRRHFPDMDHLLGEILRRHLRAIVSALGLIPRDAPNRAQARREAYLAATRTGLGAPTEAHLLLIRDRHLLPPDEREPLEALRLSIGDILAGAHAHAALALLDTPELNAAEIELALAAIIGPAPDIRQGRAAAGKARPAFGKPRLVHVPAPDARAAPRPRQAPY